MDGRQHIANVNASSRSLKTFSDKWHRFSSMPVLLPDATPVTQPTMSSSEGNSDYNQENPSTVLVLSRSSARLLGDGVLLPLRCRYPKSLPPHHLHFNSLPASSPQFFVHLFWNRIFGDKWHSRWHKHFPYHWLCVMKLPAKLKHWPVSALSIQDTNVHVFSSYSSV